MKRRLAHVGLLVGEGLVLGIAFDSGQALSLPHGWWTPILRLSGSAMPACLALLVAIVLVAWASGGRFAAIVSGPADDQPRYLPYLGLHLAAYGATFLLTRQLFERAPTSPSSLGPLVAAWLLAIATTIGAWLCSLWSPRVLASWLRGQWRLVLGATALGFAAFGVGRLSQALWLPLRRVTFMSASLILGVVAPDTFADPATLTFGTARFAVEIAPQCSGYEGVGLAWIFVIGALWLFRDRFRFPRALVLIPLVTVLALLANVGRLTALVLVGTYVSDTLAAGGFHSYAGSILFSAVTLATVSVGLRTRWLTRAPAPSEARPAPNKAAAYLLPFLLVTAAGLVSRAFSTAEAEPLYALRPLAGVVALLALRGAYAVSPPRLSPWPLLAGLGIAAGWLILDRLLPHAAAASQPAVSSGASLLRAAMAIVVAPPVEELAFRGYAARRLSAHDFDRLPPAAIGWWGIVGSSLAFGLLHHRLIAGTLSGLCFALIYKRRGRLKDAILAHATANAALVVVAWLGGAPELWK